jgi:hypothetical protein
LVLQGLDEFCRFHPLLKQLCVINEYRGLDGRISLGTDWKLLQLQTLELVNFNSKNLSGAQTTSAQIHK